nr:hypothetical protein [Tanacetum cinerariifolium]
GSIRENKCVEIRLTFKRRAWRKKSVMDNENKDAEAIELSSSIKRCGHPMKHSYHLDVKEDSESEKEEFDFGGDTDNEEKYDPKKDADYKGEFYKSPYELKPIEPKIRVLASEKLVADTLFAMMYKPRKDDDKRRINIASKPDFCNCVENDSADRDLGIPKALHSIFVDFLQSIEHRSYKKLQRAKLEVVKLDFKKRNDHADYGIIVMTAWIAIWGKLKS